MINKWEDESNLLHYDRHCETRTECTHQNECFYCDKSTDREAPCNGVPIDDSVYSCFYCESQYGDCSVVNALTTNRTHFCRDADKRCFTHLDNESVVRGCYFDNAPDGSIQRRCSGDPKCDVCSGELCNKKPTKMYCYICSKQNTLCQYDQMYQGISQCPYPDTLDKNLGCYTIVQPDGRVERGCWEGEFKCPSPDYNCLLCDSIGCNNSTYHSSACIQCQGPALGDCGQNIDLLATEEHTRICPVLIDIPLCYIAYKNNNTEIERGCTGLNQYVAWMEPVCSRGIMNCTFCNGYNCNYLTIDLFN